jgi:homogentisate 1,2-dioxygenase
MNLEYLSGFGNEFASEALPGALPVGQNSPQKPPTACTPNCSPARRSPWPAAKRRTWLYRIQPSANHPAFVKLERQLAGGPLGAVTPNRLRWNPLDIPPNRPTSSTAWWAWSPTRGGKTGGHQHLHLPRQPLDGAGVLQRRRRTAAGAEQGRLRIATELGVLDVEPLEIAVLPRGLKFRVELLDAQARLRRREPRRAAAPAGPGPDRQQRPGQPADFLTPVAHYEDLSSRRRWCRNSSASCGPASSTIRR